MASHTSKKSKCPSCKGESTLRKSRTRNLKERIIKTISWYELYKCKNCGWRGWRANLILELRAIKKIIFYALLMIVAAFIIYNLLKLVV